MGQQQQVITQQRGQDEAVRAVDIFSGYIRHMVFYAYAVFCSQVCLEEFYGALFVVNQSESRARIPIADDADAFLHLSEFGERLAILEKNDATVENVLNYDYDEILSQMWTGFHLEHSKS